MKTICPNCGAPDSVSALAHDGEQWWNTKCPTCQKPYAWHDDGRSKKMHASSHPEFADFRAALTAWAVARWKDEVANRPLVNTHRRTLDDTWRQVIRFGGGDPDALVGPSHDVLVGESKPGRWCSCVECIGYQPEPTDEQDALQSLYEVVIAQNRAGADWGDRFGAMMTALAKASKFVKPQPPQGYCRRDDICECSPEVRSTCGNWRPLLADVQPKDERELMRDILPALRVLRTVLESAGLAFGAAKASELITDIERSVK